MEFVEDVLDFLKKLTLRIDVQKCGLVASIMIPRYQVGVNEELVKGNGLTVRLIPKVNKLSDEAHRKTRLTTFLMAPANMSTRFGCRSAALVLSKKTREHSSIMIRAKSYEERISSWRPVLRRMRRLLCTADESGLIFPNLLGKQVSTVPVKHVSIQLALL